MAEPFPCGHTRRITIGGQCGECTRYPPPRPSADMMMPPEEWCRSYGVAILDPMGWSVVETYDEPCTLADFWLHASGSTLADADGPGWAGVRRDVRLIEEATH